jgi:hypothetical protein
MFPSKAVLAAGVLSGAAIAALTDVSPARAETERLPVECSGTSSLCYKYSRCTGGATICTDWTISYWYYYAPRGY